MKSMNSIVIVLVLVIVSGCAVGPAPVSQFTINPAAFGRMGVAGISSEIIGLDYGIDAVDVRSPTDRNPESIRRFLQETGLGALLLVETKGQSETRANRAGIAGFVAGQVAAFALAAVTGGTVAPASDKIPLTQTCSVMDTSVTLFAGDGSVVFSETLQEEFAGAAPPRRFVEAAVRRLLVLN